MLNLYRPGLTHGLLLGPLILAVICFVPKGDFLFTLPVKYLTFRFIVEPDIPALSAAPAIPFAPLCPAGAGKGTPPDKLH